ncbi:ribonuclease H-like domain-containing protein [Xylariaceae sp. FL1019]|nr:ribonuclease H-like domain-containing protein [Xylariaceae sp. FL1019]
MSPSSFHDCSHPEDTHGLVSTTRGIAILIDLLYNLPTSPPSLHLDLEGVNLSRDGTVSIVQIYDRTKNTTYLVDVYTLGKDAFNTRGNHSRKTLKSILESPSVPKVFFDVRRDSDALFAHFEVKLQGIHDLQLMELASNHPRPRSYVRGLAACIENHLNLSPDEKTEFLANKQNGKALFAPEMGGSYEVFNERPLSKAVRSYCIADVHYMARLWDTYDGRRITPDWKEKLEEETKQRVIESQSPNFSSNGKHMARCPTRWDWHLPDIDDDDSYYY